MHNPNYLGITALQLGLSQLKNAAGTPYFQQTLDGKAGPATKAAIYDLARDLGMIQDVYVQNSGKADPTENMVQVFSLKEEGEQQLSGHFRVREFACRDGTDTVFIHPILPVWAEEIRKINGPFSPSSAYRTPGHNAAVGGAALSKHCWGIAMDIPAVNATPQQLYEAAEKIMGDSGGLGIYSWGIHMDCRQEKARWKE